MGLTGSGLKTPDPFLWTSGFLKFLELWLFSCIVRPWDVTIHSWRSNRRPTVLCRCRSMSRSPGSVLSWQPPAWSLVRGVAVRQIRIAIADFRNVPRYVLRTLIGVALVCGLLSVWGLHGDGAMPGMSPLSGLDPYRISSSRCVMQATDADARWNGLSPALAILDRVNRAVADWMREKHRNGLVLVGDGRHVEDGPGPRWPSTTCFEAGLS